MPLSLSKLVANRAAATVDFGDGDLLRVEFYPQRLTSAMLLRMNVAGDREKLATMRPDETLSALDSATDILTDLLASWDLVDGPDDAPVPLDRDHIAALGISIQWAILGVVIQAQAADNTGGSAGKPAASVASVSAPVSDATC